MSSGNGIEVIGFPAPLLGEHPVRLPVLWRSPRNRLIVLEKPPGVAVLPDNWYGRCPVLAHALNHQIARGKPELRRMGMERELFAVHGLDPEVAGPVLFTDDAEELDDLRNALGSGIWRFRFRLVATGGGNAENLQCALPLARHREEAKMVVSHTTGKSTRTLFHRIASIGGAFAEWEAETDYARLHQVFVHARECGLRVVGDSRYAGAQPLSLADLKRNYRPSRRHEDAPPLYPGPMVRLGALRFGVSADSAREVDAPAPRKWNSAIRLLREHA